MDSLEFRSQMIEKLRAFEKWAWLDSHENPEGYTDMDYEAWFALFMEYVN